jgi:O-antigen/teichoic acid export membrane protein
MATNVQRDNYIGPGPILHQFAEIGGHHHMKSIRFFKGLSWLLVLNLLVKPLWIFGIDRQVQNTVGHEAYGSYFSILGLSVVLLFLADAGLTNMMNRQLALGEAPGIRQLFRYKCGLSAAYLLVLFGAARAAGVRQMDVVMLVGIIQVFTSLFVFFRNILTGHQLFTTDSWLSVADKALMIVACGVLLYAPVGAGLNIERFLLLQAASTGVALAVAAWLVLRRRFAHHHVLPLATIVRQTLPFTLLILLIGLHGRIDAFLLERFHPNGAFEAGVYAAAYRLTDAGNMLGYLAASFLVPFAARHLNDPALIGATVLRLRHVLLLAAVCGTAAVAALARPVMTLLYHRTDDYHATVLTLCIAVLPAYYLVHLYGSLLTARGAFKTFTRIVLFSVALNLAANALLIGPYGAAGCCVAALVSQYVCGLLCAAVATRSCSIPVKRASIAGYLAAGVLVFLACRLMLHFLPL